MKVILVSLLKQKQDLQQNENSKVRCSFFRLFFKQVENLHQEVRPVIFFLRSLIVKSTGQLYDCQYKSYMQHFQTPKLPRCKEVLETSKISQVGN